jgi:hypothetical protein
MSFYKQNPHNTTLLLFSCPGQEEKKLGYPCAGITGKNLAILLEELHHLNPEEFTKERESYYINNAWDKVEYEGSTGRTEATQNDILSDRNIERLNSEISHVEKIICFGDKAKTVIEKLIKNEALNSKVQIHYGPHLGFQSINRQVKNDIDGNPLLKGESDNTRKRLTVIAKSILENRIQ